MNNLRFFIGHFCAPIIAINRRWRAPWLLPLVLLCLFLFPQPVLAQSEDAATSEPFTVNVSLAILDIPKIDEPTETFDLDAYLRLTWKDPSAYDEVVEQGLLRGGSYESGSTEQAQAALTDIGWFYIMEFANQDSSREILDSTLKIEPDGSIEYFERFQVTLRSDYDLHKYPFDSQRLRIRIESFAYDASKVIFKADQIMFYRPVGSEASRLVLEDWNLPQEMITESGVTHSQLFDTDWPYINVFIEVEREFEYHLCRIFLPLVLIILASWSVFWIGREKVGNRLNITLISFLAAVSFSSIINSSLPKISYLTMMDYFIIGIYVFMALAVIEILITYILTGHRKKALADRINHHSRWVFPFGLLFYSLALLVIV